MKIAKDGNVQFHRCANRCDRVKTTIRAVLLANTFHHVVLRFYGTMAVPSFERLAKRGEDGRKNGN